MTDAALDTCSIPRPEMAILLTINERTDMTQTQAAAPAKFAVLSHQEGNNRLLDVVMRKIGVRKDAGLSRALGVAPPVISKIRHGRLGVGATLLVNMHLLTDMPVRDLIDAAQGVE